MYHARSLAGLAHRPGSTQPMPPYPPSCSTVGVQRPQPPPHEHVSHTDADEVSPPQVPSPHSTLQRVPLKRVPLKSSVWHAVDPLLLPWQGS